MSSNAFPMTVDAAKESIQKLSVERVRAAHAMLTWEREELRKMKEKLSRECEYRAARLVELAKGGAETFAAGSALSTLRFCASPQRLEELAAECDAKAASIIERARVLADLFGNEFVKEVR